MCLYLVTYFFLGEVAFKNGVFFGKITIKYKNGKGKTEIPFYVTVFEGGISYDSQITRYFISARSDNLSSRHLKIKNNFLGSLRLINYTLPEAAQKYFKVIVLLFFF